MPPRNNKDHGDYSKTAAILFYVNNTNNIIVNKLHKGTKYKYVKYLISKVSKNEIYVVCSGECSEKQPHIQDTLIL